MADQQETQVVTPVTGTTKFGYGQLGNPTPMWVTWIFRTEFVINKAAMLWLASTNLITADNLKETILALTIIDFVVWGLGRFVGISKDQMEDDK